MSTQEAVQTMLEAKLKEILAYGKWVLVAYGWGYRPPEGSDEPVTFAVMTSTIDEFPSVIDFLTRELDYDFNFGQSISLKRMKDLEARYSAVRVWEIPLPGFSGDPTGDPRGVRLVRDTCARFAATRWHERGVALVDICGFTKQAPTRQLASIMSLNRAMNTAYARLWRISEERKASGRWPLPLSFRRSTTGDGYYVWNDTWGRHGDAMVLALLMQTMAVLEHRQSEAREHPIRARAGFTVGEVFCFADRGVTWFEEGGQIVVGPATNYLARILGKTVPGQFVVGEFQRTAGKDGPPLGPTELLDEATAALAEQLSPDVSTATEWRFDPEGRVRVVDKHGESHYCHNVVSLVGSELGTNRFMIRVGVPLDSTPDIGGLRFAHGVAVQSLPSGAAVPEAASQSSGGAGAVETTGDADTTGGDGAEG